MNTVPQTESPVQVPGDRPQTSDRYDLGNGNRWKALLKQSGVFWALIALCVIAALVSPPFLHVENLINITRQIAIVGIISIGMTFVILTAGIDLSVGSTVSIVAVISADMLRSGVSIPVAILVGLAVGVVMGALNGLGVTLGKMPPFIITLGLMVAGQGIALTYAKGQPVSLGEAASSIQWLGGGNWLGIPAPVWIFAVVFLISAFVLNYTKFGRNVYAVGDNPEAARLSGINVNFILFVVYMICGLLAALSALIFISRLTVGEPTAGTGLELDAIAMVVIGGTSLFGGEGKISGTLIGAAIVAVIANLLNLIGVSPFSQQIVKGLIIIVAVLLERRKHK